MSERAGCGTAGIRRWRSLLVLHELGGTGLGVIGALSAVGLRLGRMDGRYLSLPGLHSMRGEMSVAERLRATARCPLHLALQGRERLPERVGRPAVQWQGFLQALSGRVRRRPCHTTPSTRRTGELPLLASRLASPATLGPAVADVGGHRSQHRRSPSSQAVQGLP